MLDGFGGYLFFFAIGMLGVFVGRRIAIRKVMKKRKNLV
jgi:hypothetical protein